MAGILKYLSRTMRAQKTPDVFELLRQIMHAHYPGGKFLEKEEPYLRCYAEYLGPIRTEPLRLLELGVRDGDSLLLWRDFLPNARIVGMDIEPKPIKLEDCGDRLRFVQGDQSDPVALQQAIAANDGLSFDIIIDDCSHVGYLTRASFDYLYSKYLVPGGLYVVEDYGVPCLMPHSFVEGEQYDSAKHAVTEGKRLQSYDIGIMGFVKSLIDHMNAYNMPDKLPVEEVRFFPNIAFVRKGR